jgi:hypothetical protein
MIRILGKVLVLLTALLAAPVAEAGPIVYFDMMRSVSLFGQHFENTTTGQWDVLKSTVLPLCCLADHRSNIGQLGIRAQFNMAILSNSDTGPSVNNISQLFTSFALDVPYLADLDFGLGATDSAHTEGFLYDQTNDIMLAELILDAGFKGLTYEGVLQPGLYSLYLLTQVSAPAGKYFGHGQVSGNLDLTSQDPAVIPEPATMTLFGMGLVATAWRRRHTNRSSIGVAGHPSA